MPPKKKTRKVAKVLAATTGVALAAAAAAKIFSLPDSPTSEASRRLAKRYIPPRNDPHRDLEDGFRYRMWVDG